jgi:hypothetical protein
VHLGKGGSDIGIAGRIVRAVPRLTSRIVGLQAHSPRRHGSVEPTDCFDDILDLATERWEPLLRTWADCPVEAAHRVAALRLLADSAPESLWPVVEPLLQIPLASLSVKQWGAQAGVDRTTLYRQMVARGLSPSDVADLARTLRVLAVFLSAGSGRPVVRPPWPGKRTMQRIFVRTLGRDSLRWISGDLGDSASVRRDIVLQLRQFIAARVQSRMAARPQHLGDHMQPNALAAPPRVR